MTISSPIEDIISFREEARRTSRQFITGIKGSTIIATPLGRTTVVLRRPTITIGEDGKILIGLSTKNESARFCPATFSHLNLYAHLSLVSEHLHLRSRLCAMGRPPAPAGWPFGYGRRCDHHHRHFEGGCRRAGVYGLCAENSQGSLCSDAWVLQSQCLRLVYQNSPSSRLPRQRSHRLPMHWCLDADDVGNEGRADVPLKKTHPTYESSQEPNCQQLGNSKCADWYQASELRRVGRHI